MRSVGVRRFTYGKGDFMRKDIAKILITEEEIDRITTRLAAEIDRDYAGDDKNLVLVCLQQCRQHDGSHCKLLELCHGDTCGAFLSE